jgi:hypothetical protein
LLLSFIKLLLLRGQFSFKIILSMPCTFQFDADAYHSELERLGDRVIPKCGSAAFIPRPRGPLNMMKASLCSIMGLNFHSLDHVYTI